MDKFLDKVKKKVTAIGEQKTVDANFEAARANYESYVQYVQGLKNKIDGFMAHSKGLVLAADQVSGEFANLFASFPNSKGHHYSNLSIQAKEAQDNLMKASDQCEKQMDVGALKRIGALTELFANFKARIKERAEALETYDYETTKVRKAQESRDKALSGGKRESASDQESREKHETLLVNATGDYMGKNQSLITDLTAVYDGRFDALGPVLAEFLTVEKTLASLINNNLTPLKIPNAPTSALASISNFVSSAFGSGDEKSSSSSSSSKAKPALPPVPSKSGKSHQEGSSDLTVDDMQAGLTFYKNNKEDVHAAAAFAADHKEEAQAVAKYAANNKEQVKSGLKFLASNKST
jgi:hypothetical protein